MTILIYDQFDTSATFCRMTAWLGYGQWGLLNRAIHTVDLGIGKKLKNLGAAVAIYAAHHNSCRKHSTIKTAPVVAAGVTGDIWTLEELYDRAMECC